jgi:Tfp pilus assembly protein PilV
MYKKQLGVSLSGLLISAFIVVVLALLALKIVPAYIEFATAKKAINAIASEGATSVADVRKSFDARATIDDITAVSANDLVITKQGGQVVISFSYRKEVPLFANVGLYFNFAASTQGLEQ